MGAYGGHRTLNKGPGHFSHAAALRLYTQSRLGLQDLKGDSER
jgi:hypothetical protein